MSRREARHTYRQLTPEERLRVAEARRLVALDEAEIKQQAREFKQEYESAQAALHDALKLLKAERLKMGLSLADIEQRTGIGRPNLSRLENEAEANPTIGTLTRYAEALGKRLLIVLMDGSAIKT
ncbi:MAG: helix-turn-helix transcriptional regulator [Pirellulaceae bacterium]